MPQDNVLSLNAFGELIEPNGKREYKQEEPATPAPVVPPADKEIIPLTRVTKDEKPVLLPDSPKDGGSEVWIHQQAWLHLGNFSEGKEFAYSMKNSKNGLYVMTIEGSVVIENQLLEKRDAMGIWETDTVQRWFKDDAE